MFNTTYYALSRPILVHTADLPTILVKSLNSSLCEIQLKINTQEILHLHGDRCVKKSAIRPDPKRLLHMTV